MLVKFLFYGYAAGVSSSRNLERSSYGSLAFQFIATNAHPDTYMKSFFSTFKKRIGP
jgi:Transposase domain (DUF772)